jgi:hypothetical protein
MILLTESGLILLPKLGLLAIANVTVVSGTVLTRTPEKILAVTDEPPGALSYFTPALAIFLASNVPDLTEPLTSCILVTFVSRVR